MDRKCSEETPSNKSNGKVSSLCSLDLPFAWSGFGYMEGADKHPVEI
jgi:hypothetical protein